MVTKKRIQENKEQRFSRGKSLLTGALFIGSFSLLYFALPVFTSVTYNADSLSGDTKDNTALEHETVVDVKSAPQDQIKEPEFIVTHIPIPDAVKGAYMTACVAGTPSIRKDLVKLIEDTELNSIIIDIKDYSGTISFHTKNPILEGVNGTGCRVSDMKEFIGSLHDKGIYVIGRITVFQDSYYTKAYPELAVKKMSNKSQVWSDYKGINFIDAGAEPFWDYIIAIAKESYSIGFDEINFDYIRFPSDGNMKDIYYPFSEQEIDADPDMGKAKVVRKFFAYLRNALKDTGVVMSADLFGMTTTNADDLNIGQVLEYAEPYFDFIAPMVYPSHYPTGFRGYENVNAHPYDIVNFSMTEAARRLTVASSTPLKLRPWLQDFDYPVTYTSDMVRTQIQATYDAGLTSWMLWDPSNKYTPSALRGSEE